MTKTKHVVTGYHKIACTIRMALSIVMPRITVAVHILITVVRRLLGYAHRSPVARIEAAADREDAKTARLIRKLEATRKLVAANARLLEAKNANSQLRKSISRELDSGWENRRIK